MPDTQLNPDALEAAARALLAMQQPEVSADYAWNVQFDDGREELRKEAAAAVSAYLAVALPEVTSVEELDALPIGAVIVINGTMLQAEDRDDYGTMWSRVRDIDAYPSDALALPARVLHIPEVNDA